MASSLLQRETSTLIEPLAQPSLNIMEDQQELSSKVFQ